MYSGEGEGIQPGLISGEGGGPEAVQDSSERISRRSPGLAKEYGKLAKLSAAKGRPKEAIAHYKEALILDPESSELHRDFGLFLAQQGHLKEAAEYLKHALELNPKDKSAREYLDKVLAQLES